VRQKEIGRGKTIRGPSKNWRKGDAKGEIVSEGIAQVIDGLDNPLLASALFEEAGVLRVHANENETFGLICSG
jgi:hypothetical protein